MRAVLCVRCSFVCYSSVGAHRLSSSANVVPASSLFSSPPPLLSPLSLHATELDIDDATLDTMVRQTRLGEVAAADVFEVIMGYLGRVPVAERSGLPMAMKLPAFTNAMRTFARPGVGRGGARALDLALARLYAAFDESGTGLVDATELAAGLARLSAQLGASPAVAEAPCTCGELRCGG